MEQKKYSVEQFKMKFVKPTLDREYVTRFTQYSHKARSFCFVLFFQITFRCYTSESTSKISLVNN